MTHSSNIPVSAELENAFANARTQEGVRYLKVIIRDEALYCVGTFPETNNIQNDFATVQSHMEPKIPCYILFKLDAAENRWLCLSYVPDGSPVKQRMLYASTRDAMKKQLGKSYFVLDMYGSTKEEFTWAAYEESLKKPASSAPLTAAEMQYASEAHAEVDPGHSREYVHSVRFPLSNTADQALRSFSSNKNFVQLKVDAEKETIELVAAKKVGVDRLAAEISTEEPRFTFYKYEHNWEGTPFESNVFIYSCPEGAPVKLRMLYSTVKSVVSGAAEGAGIQVDRNGKLELDDPTEATPDLLNQSLHPQVEVQKSFARPSRPGRGKPRLTRK
jgi:twinfilin-like protein